MRGVALKTAIFLARRRARQRDGGVTGALVLARFLQNGGKRKRSVAGAGGSISEAFRFGQSTFGARCVCSG